MHLTIVRSRELYSLIGINHVCWRLLHMACPCHSKSQEQRVVVSPMSLFPFFEVWKYLPFRGSGSAILPQLPGRLRQQEQTAVVGLAVLLDVLLSCAWFWRRAQTDLSPQEWRRTTTARIFQDTPGTSRIFHAWTILYLSISGK